MPIYEYACNSCGHRLDALQKISEEPLVDCPECGDATLKRLLSAPRFRLKGEGWYETDFKKENQRNLAKGDAEPDKKGVSEKDGTGEAGKSDAGKDSGDKKKAATPAPSAGKTDAGKSAAE